MDQSKQEKTYQEILPGWSMGIRRIKKDDGEEIYGFLHDHWSSHEIVSLKKVHDATLLEGFIAPSPAGDLNGLITLDVTDHGCEIVTMNSVYKGRGTGTNLMSCAEIFARETSCKRLWLVTSNDNVEAMAFYMRRGFRMSKVHRDALNEARKSNPSIPTHGHHGIEMHDLVEFERILSEV